MGGNDDNSLSEGRRWSEFLLPAVQSKPEAKNHSDGQEYVHRGGDEGADEGEEEQSLGSLQSHVSFAELPSYMRSKSGMEMDPDRVSCELVFGRRAFPLLGKKTHTSYRAQYFVVIQGTP